MRTTPLLALLLYTIGGCDDGAVPSGDGDYPMDMGGPAASCSAPAGPLRRTAVNELLMPTGAMPCSIDVDGDGKPDNALALAVSALRAVFDLQTNVDALLRNGDLVELLAVQSESALTSGCAGLSLQRGKKPPAPPAFDGSDSFVADDAAPATKLLGTITKGHLETVLPEAQTPDALARLPLALSAGFGVDLPLPLSGVHANAAVRNQGAVSGELHGVVRMDEVQNKTIPAIARTITAFIRQAPQSGAAKELITRFETQAKCDANPRQCCARSPATCEITAEEVRSSKLVMTFLKPDVQMWRGDTWAPNPNGDMPDSLSVGLCWNAVSARF